MKSGFERCEEFCVNSESVAKAKERVPGGEKLDLLARTYQALGEVNRLKILLSLCVKELCVCELGEVLEMSAPAVSHHLRRLKDLGLVKSRRAGKLAYYSLDDEHIRTLLETGQIHVEHRFRL